MDNNRQIYQASQHMLDGMQADRNAKATNDRLERLLEHARAESAEQQKAVEDSRQQARHAIWAAWAGVGVAIVVGVATILITINS